MSTPQSRPPAGAAEPGTDDPTIPVLTERLGLPPLEFDTTLPLIETTAQMLEPMLGGLTALPSPPQAPTAAALTMRDAALFDLSLPEHPAPGPRREAFAPAALPATAAPLPAPAPSAAPAPAPPPAPASAPLLAPRAGRAGFDGGHWARIEVELRSSILRSVGEHLPHNIEAIVREQLHASIEQLVGRLAAETHGAISTIVRQSVEQAVRTELERLRNTSRGSA